jgi:preprotein translocase SecE subunit
VAEEKKTSSASSDKKATDKKVKKKSKKNPFKSIASFFKSVKSEGKKVVWAKPKEVLKNTIIVLIVCVIVGVCIYAVDTGLSLCMKGIKNLAENTTVSTDADETEDTDTEDTEDADTEDTEDTDTEDTDDTDDTLISIDEEDTSDSDTTTVDEAE